MTVGLDPNQSQPEATVNQMVFGKSSIDVAGGIDVVIVDFNATFAQLDITGALTVDISLILPDEKNMTLFSNKTTGGFTITIKPAGGTGIVITQGSRCIIACDGAGTAYKAAPEIAI